MMGIHKFYEITEYERTNILAESYHWCDCNRYRYYRSHIMELIKSFEMLYDEESKKIMNEYIRIYIERGIYSLASCDGRVKYFFGEDTENGYEILYTNKEEDDIAKIYKECEIY